MGLQQKSIEEVKGEDGDETIVVSLIYIVTLFSINLTFKISGCQDSIRAGGQVFESPQLLLCLVFSHYRGGFSLSF